MIKDRIIQVVEYKGIAKENFYKKIGMTSASFRGKAKETPINSTAIENILSEIQDLNSEWLLTGKGEMLKKDQPLYGTQIYTSDTINETEMIYKEPKSINTGIPLIPIDAMAGYGTGSMQIMDYETSYYEVPEFTELRAEFMIRVKGSSMYPKYSSGDLIACKKISLNTFFQWNKVYVLDTEQGALIKRVKKSQKENCILLVSDNANYDPFDIHLDNIYSIACVLGVIRLE
ncbi:helix-turn-helix transcriptional regulator [Elizabethkingia bruuniana]|uniref:Helix-turn-helix transcriptional regulator n=1 Tax=Elizabethkingia bruuniana TaxID=1756149 RepID=A0A7T7ZZ79_9FLAO|nr:S24 family peptidase [Elizabethkingia bruuniana]KGO09147.1 hypothetical protein KS04_16340 [Elizabethkingia miricola]AQX86127.1 hypothetical protein AYC65_14430 [Elizabethkingia bruuniana]KUY24639.1 hypothetical protein ATB97_08760 [Elizabethkingia bruuniana]OPB61691.1 hypothetical protein BAY12_11740 [Elizabethkingia bruuniana]QDZ64541.1 helix-turn-helix transcriptional regulator [Elizabethkingia bruuniana]